MVHAPPHPQIAGVHRFHGRRNAGRLSGLVARIRDVFLSRRGAADGTDARCLAEHRDDFFCARDCRTNSRYRRDARELCVLRRPDDPRIRSRGHRGQPVREWPGQLADLRCRSLRDRGGVCGGTRQPRHRIRHSLSLPRYRGGLCQSKAHQSIVAGAGAGAAGGCVLFDLSRAGADGVVGKHDYRKPGSRHSAPVAGYCHERHRRGAWPAAQHPCGAALAQPLPTHWPAPDQEPRSSRKCARPGSNSPPLPMPRRWSRTSA